MMRWVPPPVIFLLTYLLCSRFIQGATPEDTLRLHPENRHYFQWRGDALIIIGSGEHYGAVLNADFDFRKYLLTLGKDGLNHTRLFTGAAYVEPAGAFNIAKNTLAPAAERYLAPWARSGEPGYAGGGMRFDLERWDSSYFRQLRDFVTEAGQQSVIVEVTLFCPFYEESQWRLSPFHPSNNIQEAGTGVTRTNVYTLHAHGGLLAYQERFVRRVVAELRELDNVYYEVCNEPYFGGVTSEWQDHIASIITNAQIAHPNPKLISRNIANDHALVEKPYPNISIYNFHYATPPDAVAMNWHLNYPIGDNETGFRGTNDAPYRMEAWDFILAGGALFSHLDYSFAAGHEDGTFDYPASQPGGGNPALRRQFRNLRYFMSNLDFIHSYPSNAIIAGGIPPSHTARALVQPDRAAGIYIRPRNASHYSVRWTGLLHVPRTGEYRFQVTGKDPIRVWIADRLVADLSTKNKPGEAAKPEVHLDRGAHPIKVEYVHRGGDAAVTLSWALNGDSLEPIPPSAFRLPDDSEAGLQGDYFIGQDLQNKWHTRIDPQIHFNWGRNLPFTRSPDDPPIRLELSVPTGAWIATWIDPISGNVLKDERLRHKEGLLVVEAPPFLNDVALRLSRP